MRLRNIFIISVISIILIGISVYAVRSKCEYLFEVKYEYQIPEYSLREREIIKNVFSKILDNVNIDHPIYIEKVTEKKDSIIVDIMPVSALRLGKSRIEKLFGLFTIFTMFDYKTRFIFDKEYKLLNPEIPEV